MIYGDATMHADEMKVNPLEPCVSSLPVAAVLPELLAALKSASCVLLNAPTGAGKSTWLPLHILQQGGSRAVFYCLSRVVWLRVTSHSGWRKA